MKKILRTVFLTALALTACSSLVFADIAPLPDDPVRRLSPAAVLCLIVVIIVVIALLVRTVKKKGK